ncbi:ribose 1,5-bisphosphate isomerase [Candidatus Methanoplasma termitum]|uniref:Ribose 1,5-bisphosphate isomerase n=1 Tax=Candidatus Methanoplasma termitum TaxID=1577791 RepID=A0A0A7LDU9_9ARCH|nr:ribose 1,5-bisphosphate isomerase [Candidatus Methanoplasma termitum]AIZ57138.1 ribose 1,5-bisphosphate isomerase [Candidatus Methanoplasma termitum]
MTDTVKATASDIKEMKIRGAGRIARAGASAMGKFAEDYNGGSLEDFKKDIDKAKKIILDSRPTAVSLWNGVQASVKDVGSAASLGEAKASVVRNAASFVKMSSSAVETIAKIGAKRVEKGDTLLTHCNSSAALGIIKEAHLQGKDIKVYATESRPWRQGLLTVKELSDAGVDVTLIIDSAVRAVMKDIDKVFVGADTVTSNGALINKVGTSQLALAANEARVPFSVCTETYKFSPMTIFGDMVEIEERDCGEVVKADEISKGVKIYNPVFDTTPAKYIDAYITELGVISPGSVYDVMVKQLGNDIFK